jgi:hypothetical protein
MDFPRAQVYFVISRLKEIMDYSDHILLSIQQKNVNSLKSSIEKITRGLIR